MNLIINDEDLAKVDEKLDTKIVKEIGDELEINLKETPLSVSRIGKAKCKILITFQEEDLHKRQELLSRSKELRKSARWSNTFIQPDLTLAEQKLAFELRKDLRRTREENPGKIFIIKHGKIIEVEKEQ